MFFSFCRKIYFFLPREKIFPAEREINRCFHNIALYFTTSPLSLFQMRCFQPNPSYRPHTCPSLIQQQHSKGVISNDTLTTFLPCNVQLYYHTKFHFYVNLHTSTIPLHYHFSSFCRCFRPETTHFINTSTLSPTRFFHQ